MKARISLLKTRKKYFFLGGLLIPFFSFTMALTDLPFDWIKQCIKYFELPPNTFLLDEQANELEKDKHKNSLKYFYKNILSFGCVNKKINGEINNFLSKESVEPFPFYKAIMQLHKEKELLLFYSTCINCQCIGSISCQCLSKEGLYCIIKLHFFAEGDNCYSADRTHNYALIFYLYKYDTCVEVLKIAPDMHRMALDSDLLFFSICKNYTESRLVQNSLKELEHLGRNARKLNQKIISVEILNDINLYKLPVDIYFFLKPFTYDTFCWFMKLQYDERVKNT